jgi:teichuronic acid biosynthesis glycosyltransferase TuaH
VPKPDLRPLVVICAATYWHATTMLDHHLARELATYAEVVYLEPPTSFLTRWRSLAGGEASVRPWRERVEHSITVIRPRVNPLMEQRLGKPLALALTRRTMRRAVGGYGTRPVRAVVLMSLNPLFDVLGEQFRVFYASDDLAAGASLMGINDPALVRQAVRLPRRADVVVAVSPPLVDRLRKDGVEALLIPNGVYVQHFAAAASSEPAADLVALGPRRVGFVGHLGDRIDADLVAAVAERGCTVLLVGPRQRTATPGRLEALLRRPNVHWVGRRPYAQLPSVLAAADVWMLPYGDSEFNRASFPLKLLEYLAAGRRVVATDLPAVRWLDTGLVDVARTPADFADAVEAALRRPLTAAESARRIDFATAHGWPERIRPLAARIGLQRGEPR